ncbi:hypothetical protein SLEP1_g50014 [Rubroshorea leprosula]|uniref:tRNA-uridine aminocarboxypropyltransferase n=1 Tax=Rubroshorea leprosula TaxID=152421 RepID=A0AAV5LYX4_9ROSI|nr:hypothetical protein SLEP1_g50014 [Rubroshorea leprosula]
MLHHFRTGIVFPARNNPFTPLLSPLRRHRRRPTTNLKMAVTESVSKRPICPACSKPARVCLCCRIRNPCLDNSVSVTILQHSLEKKHHLNTARIAKLGLKNLTVVTVSDVNYEARNEIRLVEQRPESVFSRNGLESSGLDTVSLIRKEVSNFEFRGNMNCPEEDSTDCIDDDIEKSSNMIACNGECSLGNDRNIQMSLGGSNFGDPSDFLMSNGLTVGVENESRNVVKQGSFDTDVILDVSMSNEAILGGRSSRSLVDKLLVLDCDQSEQQPVITATIGRYGVISDVYHVWMGEAHLKAEGFDGILGSEEVMKALAKGFVVKKFQKEKPSWWSKEAKEHEEFALEVPPGSVLLFPSEKAVDTSLLKAMNFEAKNLIVLDGTWAKALRMYCENPWLKMLPHLRLDVEKMSLYSEVRQQPKEGYLSTIESIVYALKALGNDLEGLDNLLDVFESMVGDQRRCKDERLSKVSIDME